MANYKSQYTGQQIDEAIGKALNGGTGGSGGTQLYICRIPCMMEGETPANFWVVSQYDAPITTLIELSLMTQGMGLFFGIESEFAMMKGISFGGNMAGDMYLIMGGIDYNPDTEEYEHKYSHLTVSSFDLDNATVSPF